MEQSEEINQNWTAVENADIWFCQLFECNIYVLFLRDKFSTQANL